MAEILCSTGALIGRPNGRDYKLLSKLAKQLDCDGFEFMMYDSWYHQAEEILVYLCAEKISIPVMHCEKHIGESISKGGAENFAEAYGLFEINCKMARELGAKKLVIHLWDGITSDAHFENNVQAYPRLLETARQNRLDLLVENVVCNQQSPMEHWCQLAEAYPNIHFVFDTKMAAFHSQLELLYQPEYAWLWEKGHIQHYHVNDYAGGYKDWSNLRTLPVGRGQIDFERFFAYIKQTGYQDTFTLEGPCYREDGMPDIQVLNDQISQVRKMLK